MDVKQPSIRSPPGHYWITIHASALDLDKNINQLMKTVKVVEDDSQKATRALESALESIGQDLQTLYSDTTASRQSSASPEDLLKINRALAEATGKAVAASNSKKQEDVVSVANTGRKVISDLLNTIKVGVTPCLIYSCYISILAINVTIGSSLGH